MKYLKFFEGFDRDINSIVSDIENILVELRDNGLDFSIAPPGVSSLYISITSKGEDEIFHFNSIIIDRLLFLNDYLKSKYDVVTMKVNDDFMEPTDCDKTSLYNQFSDEITFVEIQIFFKGS